MPLWKTLGNPRYENSSVFPQHLVVISARNHSLVLYCMVLYFTVLYWTLFSNICNIIVMFAQLWSKFFCAATLRKAVLVGQLAISHLVKTFQYLCRTPRYIIVLTVAYICLLSLARWIQSSYFLPVLGSAHNFMYISRVSSCACYMHYPSHSPRVYRPVTIWLRVLGYATVLSHPYARYSSHRLGLTHSLHFAVWVRNAKHILCSVISSENRSICELV
jgi:hypothetical protein